MNLIELTNATLVNVPAEGAVLFALNTDGTVNRVKADAVGGTKTAVIEIRLAEDGNTAECDMTYAEAEALMLTTKNLDVTLVMNGRDNGKRVITCVKPEIIDYVQDDPGYIKITKGSMVINWDADGFTVDTSN